jgi:hypothetical protein
MNLFKPRRTFESVMRELIAGLEDGSIVLSKEDETSQSEKQNGAIQEQAKQVLPQSAPAVPQPGGPPQR